MAIHVLGLLAVPIVLHIAGTSLPAIIPQQLLLDVTQQVASGLVKDETSTQKIIQVAPDLVPLVLAAAGITLPYASLAITGLVLMIEYSKPPTPEEQQRMWDQAQGVH